MFKRSAPEVVEKPRPPKREVPGIKSWRVRWADGQNLVIQAHRVKRDHENGDLLFVEILDYEWVETTLWLEGSWCPIQHVRHRVRDYIHVELL